MSKRQNIRGMVFSVIIAGVFVTVQPAAALTSPQVILDVRGSMFQVTGTVTTTTSITSTADLTGTSMTTATDSVASSGVLLPSTGVDQSQPQRNVNIQIIPLLMLLSGIALVIATILMSIAQRSYRQQNDDR